MRAAKVGRLFLGLLLALAVPETPRAQDRGGATLFVSSDPPGAVVVLDGTRLEHAAPVVLLDLTPGDHSVEIALPGYAPYAAKVTLTPSVPGVVSAVLPRMGFLAGAPDADIVFAGVEVAAAGRYVDLPPGTYTFDRDPRRRLTIVPAYPRQRLIDALAIGIPLFVGFATYLTIDGVMEPAADRAVPPAAVATYATSATMIGLEVWLQADKRRFRERTALQAEVESDPAAQQAAFDEAVSLLASDRLTEALAAFSRIAPRSRLYPQAIYKRASIHLLNGAYADALANFDRIVRDYPLPDLYDRSLKAAADILVRLERYPEALERLNRMVFLDVLYGHEEIDRYRCQVLGLWSARDPGVLARAIAAYGRLVGTYGSSPQIDTYRIELASLLITAGRRLEGREQIRAVLESSRDEEVLAQARALERSLAIPP